MRLLRVLIADDSRRMRAALRSLLATVERVPEELLCCLRDLAGTAC